MRLIGASETIKTALVRGRSDGKYVVLAEVGCFTRRGLVGKKYLELFKDLGDILDAIARRELLRLHDEML